MPLICFASPKGGVGKTTLSANVAEALRREGRTVIAIDLDPQNSLRLHFGVPVADQGGFASHLAQRPAWRDYLRRYSSGTLLLPYGTVGLRQALDNAVALEREPELLAAPLRDMLADPDCVVVADMLPGYTQALATMMPMATLLVTVLRSETISAAMLADIEAGRFFGTGTMKALFAGRLQFVLNGVDLKDRFSRMTAEAVARHLGSRLLGAVSQDQAVASALASQRLLHETGAGSQAANDIRLLAAAIETKLAALSPSVPVIAGAEAPAAHWAAQQVGAR